MPEFAVEFKDALVTNIWSFESFHHRRFLVIETSHGFFRIEQWKKCINLSFSFTREDFVKKSDGKLRFLAEFARNKNESPFSNLKEILEWIHLNNKLKNDCNICNIL